MSKQYIIQLLSKEWQKSGVEKGDVLLVHSSLKKVFLKLISDHDYKADTQTILLSLIDAVGETGTLLLPLFNFDFGKTRQFDIRHTPSQMGALTESARLFPGAVRTGHPIYSFAVIGKQAYKFEEVKNFSGYGADSPFALLKEMDGKIAIIGLSDQNSMTSYHYVEEMNEVPYRYHKKFTGSYTDNNGHTEEATFNLFVRDIENGVKTDVNRMMDFLWEKKLFKGSKYDEGFGMRTIKMSDFYETVNQIIKEGKAIDYLYSVEKLAET